MQWGVFGRVLTHYYFGVKLETVWDVVTHEIPELLAQLAVIIPSVEVDENRS